MICTFAVQTELTYFISMIGKIVLEFDEVDSTNIIAAELIKTEKFQEGMVISARFQRKGKGQEGNYWESEAGKNLLVSVILSPEFLLAEKQFVLNKIVSLAVAEFIKKILPKEDVKIKWPNDIYIGDEKVAGILINNIIKGDLFEYTIIGIGINVNQKVFLSDAPNPVSITQLSGKMHDLKEALELLTEILNRWYELLRRAQHESISEKYLSSLYRMGTFYTYKISDEEVMAKIIGISEYGWLVLESKEKKYTSVI